MLARLRRWLRPPPPPKRKHPTPEMAYDSLAEGRCLYHGLTKCSGPPRLEGLRDNLDDHDILVCKAHYGALRRIDGQRLDQLERYLMEAFAAKNLPRAMSEW
ncbi:MAG: hypothetical protein H0V79_02635 [Actinobacteria bacterium]|nr:hypothetical protein [Actinomycetota bacterium]